MAHVLTTQVASRDMTPSSRGQRSRSQNHVTYSIKKCNNSILGDRIHVILGWYITCKPTKKIRILATGPRILDPRILSLQTPQNGVHVHREARSRDPNYVSWYAHKLHCRRPKCSDYAYFLTSWYFLKPQIWYRKNCIQSIQWCVSRHSKTAKIKCYKL